MTRLTYNVSIAIGLVLIGFGEAFESIPRALMMVGSIVIVLTLATAAMARKL